MYKGISKFLTRIRTKVSDFSNFIRLGGRTQSRLADKGLRPPRWLERIPPYSLGKKPVPTPTTIEEDRPPAIPFGKEHRLALWIGESTHEGCTFVLETKMLILEMAGANQMTCSEIARQLNRINSAKLRSGEWNDALVYHFTRHYMSIRPVFYPEDRSTPF